MDRTSGDQQQGFSGGGSSSTSGKNTDSAYEPRRSARVTANTSGDGDVWQEKLMVCEADGNKLVIRSYFRSTKSGKRVWDEPPTGASQIEAASAADRQKVQEELKNMQVALDTNNENVGGEEGKGKAAKKSKGFFSAFRKSPKDKAGSSSSGGLFGKKKSDQHGKKSSVAKGDIDGDEDMQRAISLSMGLNPDAADANSAANGGNSWDADDEALEMAKAMSISEAESASPAATHNFTEDEMLQRALEESKRETTGVASMPSKETDFFALAEEPSGSFGQAPARTKSDDGDGTLLNQKMPALKAHPEDDFFNQKMPATTDVKPPPATANAYAMFDPYAKNDASPPARAASASPASNEQPQHDDDDAKGLRKMDSVSSNRRSSGFTRHFKKKSYENEAGVV